MYGTYVFGESWIGVGLGVRWMEYTVNCGGSHCFPTTREAQTQMGG